MKQSMKAKISLVNFSINELENIKAGKYENNGNHYGYKQGNGNFLGHQIGLGNGPIVTALGGCKGDDALHI